MMGALNRHERQTLRRIQAHLRATTLDAGVVVEQLGTVDVHFHATNPDPALNCVTPHKGVAWVRRDDLVAAFEGMVHLGRMPRLVFQDALFPAAFQQQLALMGLTLEDNRMVMVYRPFYGPVMPDEEPLGRLPDFLPTEVKTSVCSAKSELAVWLRIFRAGYYNTESLTIEPDVVAPLAEAATLGHKLFILASYRAAPLGAARIGLRGSTAELEVVATAPLWHGMGLEVALITTAVNEAMKRGADTIFTVAPTEEFIRLYRRLGFTDLTRVLTFWRGFSIVVPPPVSTVAAPTKGESV
ncbi:MAG: GNAT family N-acetyltransferase [Chloroflexi bacterium]|nr:GNAT family N-acetyltransferase [Chloroflexota bacterium]